MERHWIGTWLDAATLTKISTHAARRGVTIEDAVAGILRSSSPPPPPIGLPPPPAPAARVVPVLMNPAARSGIAARLIRSAEEDVMAANDLLVRAGAKLKGSNDLTHLPPGALDVWLDLSGCQGTLGRIIVNGDIGRLAAARGE